MANSPPQSFDVALASKTTDNLKEGRICKYHTVQRVHAAIQAQSPVKFVNGVIMMPPSSPSQDGMLKAADFAAFSAGAKAAGLIPQYVDAEVPFGVVDGVNATFALANAPSGGLQIFVRGLERQGHYALNDDGVTFVLDACSTPQAGDDFYAWYRF